MITQKEFETRIARRFPTEKFTIIKYESTGKPMIIKCEQCGEEIEVSKANNFLAPTKAYGCKNCHGLWREREEKLAKIKEKYDILDTFVKDTHTHYHIRCKKCEHERTATLSDLIRHLDCGCTTNVYRNRTPEEFLKHLNEHQNNEYELVSDYKNQITKVLIRHIPCGFIWNVRPADVINGRAHCPKCAIKESYGVKLIVRLLNEFDIKFQQEKQLNNSRQRFDFYIEYSNLKIAIEYNGSQHYNETNYFATTLRQQQERDNRKRQYCVDNNIKLIEIPYYYLDEQIRGEIIKLNDYLIESKVK